MDYFEENLNQVCAIFSNISIIFTVEFKHFDHIFKNLQKQICYEIFIKAIPT